MTYEAKDGDVIGPGAQVPPRRPTLREMIQQDPPQTLGMPMPGEKERRVIAKLSDECGTLKTTIKQKDEIIAALNDTIADVVAFMGPSQLAKFETFRKKRAKK